MKIALSPPTKHVTLTLWLQLWCNG